MTIMCYLAEIAFCLEKLLEIHLPFIPPNYHHIGHPLSKNDTQTIHETRISLGGRGAHIPPEYAYKEENFMERLGNG